MRPTSTSANDWISDTCLRFERATGVRLIHQSVTEFQEQTEPDDLAWSRAIRDHGLDFGRLMIAPDTLPADADRAELVCRLADVVVELLGRSLCETERLAYYSEMLCELVDVASHAAINTNPVQAINRLLQTALQLTKYRSIAFFLLNPGSSELRLKASLTLDTGHIPGPVRNLDDATYDLAALEQKRTTIRRHSSEAEAQWLPSDARMGMVLAVSSEDTPLGTLWAYDRRDRVVTSQDVAILASIARQIAAVLDRLVLKRESRQKQQLDRELGVASVSSAQFHNDDFNLPDGIDVSGYCDNRHEIGGDFVELLELDQERMLVAVADACGNSIPAAIVSSTTRGALRSLVHTRRDSELSTGELMAELNLVVHDLMPVGKFITMLLGLIDLKNRTFLLTNAGHPPPIIVSRTGQTKPLIASHGLMLGAIGSADYEETLVTYEPGDSLILFTDGITEAQCSRRTMFRDAGIDDVIRNREWDSAEQIVEAITDSLDEHRGRSREQDDQTLIVIRFEAEYAAVSSR